MQKLIDLSQNDEIINENIVFAYFLQNDIL